VVKHALDQPRGFGAGEAEAAMPSRLLSAFPDGVPIRRVPLDQAIARVEERLAASKPVRELA
jgi:hypothetical protein